MQFDRLHTSDDHYHPHNDSRQDLFEDLAYNHHHIHTNPTQPIMHPALLKDIYEEDDNRQEPSFNIMEESDKKQKPVPLFYKLTDDIKQEEESVSYIAHTEKMRLRRLRNDTKNIPKNFGKGIINFIQKNERKMRQLVTLNGAIYSQFLKSIRAQKKTINTIADLRRIWTDQKHGKCMRVISNLFFRQHSLEYIFNSRISNYSTHIKYRHILWQAIKDPYSFNHIKQY